MKKTILITGASSGIGKETAILFAKKGWNVVAAVRDTACIEGWAIPLGIRPVTLDVTKEETIQRAVSETLTNFGHIDVVVNNAGYGLVGPFEATPEDALTRQMDTNFFGALRVIRAVLPSMRSRKSGLIINVTSVGGTMAGPLYSSYHASKFALEGFSESLQYELRSFGIRVKLVEPGPVKTEFNGRSADVVSPVNYGDYTPYARSLFQKIEAMSQSGAHPRNTAMVIYCATRDTSSRLRYVSGKRARVMVGMRKLFGERFMRALNRAMLE